MPISKRTIRRAWSTRCSRAVEALVLTIVFAVLPELPQVNAGAVLDPHPGWIAVLVLAARYGGPGLFTGLFAAACGIGLGSVIAGAGLAVSWGGLLAPASTPKAVVDRIAGEVRQILADKEIQEKLLSAGAIARFQDPAQMGQHLQQDYAKWGQLIRDKSIASE